jgi:hypothetical protein
MADIKMTPVDSSSIDELGYDKDSKTLRILFKSSGQLWDYDEVPESVYAKLLKAPSVGKEFNSSIRGVFYGRKV